MAASTLTASALLAEDVLEAKFYAAPSAEPTRPLSDFGKVHAEYRRMGVTLLLR